MSRYAGRYEHVFESTIAGVTIQAPQLDINTVAAGGGSRLFFRSGVFQASQATARSSSKRSRRGPSPRVLQQPLAPQSNVPLL